MTRWPEVSAWLDTLVQGPIAVPTLPEAHARVALAVAVEQARAAEHHLERPAPAHTVFVASSTVFTVALEWCAVLLGRGGRVTLKAPRGLEDWYDHLAASTELPLDSTTDRAVLQQASRVVLMGSDATVSAVRAQLGGPERLLAFGSRSSLAWWTDPQSVDELAFDVRLHDGRGCMSPLRIHSPIPDAAERLAEALERLALPPGIHSPSEQAHMRQDRALAKVLGRDHGRVIELPLAALGRAGRPGLVVVHPTPTLADVPFDPATVSVFGSDGEAPAGVRVSPLGRMQRPPLDRLHDGIAWLEVV